MRKLTTTLAAACCFALLSAPAHADEVAVIAPMDIVSGPLPAGVTWPLNSAKEAVEEAEETARECLDRLTAAWVPPEEQSAKANALARLKTARCCDGKARYFLNSFADDVARIASLPPGDPQTETLYARAESSRAAACQYTSLATQNAYAASSQASRLVRLHCAPLLPRQQEAMAQMGQLMSQSIPDLVDRMKAAPEWNFYTEVD